jgi:cell division protein FtsL
LIGGISLILVLARLGCSIYVWRTLKQRKDDAEYQKNCAEIEKRKADWHALDIEKQQLRQHIVEKRRIARAIFEYQKAVKDRLKSCGYQAISRFKAAYSKRKGLTPEFFSNPIIFTYDEGSAFSNFKK